MQFTKKELLRIIIPLFVEQLLAVTVGLLDSIMVSSAGEAAVSGVSLVDSLNLLLFQVFAALAAGGSVVCAQQLGATEHEKARSTAKQTVYTAFIAAMAVMIGVLCFRAPLLKLIFGKVEQAVMDNAMVYLLFTTLSMPAMAVYNAGAAIFRAMGNSRTAMKVSVIVNVLNFLGNALLIFGFHLGAAGAAISTLFARIVGAVIIIVLLHNKDNAIYLEQIFKLRLEPTTIRSILHIGIPNGLENGMFQFGKILTQSLVSTFGTAAIAANAVSNTLAAFEYCIGQAIGLAMITIVGQAIGAGDKKQAKYYCKYLLKMEYAAMFVIVVLITVITKPVTALYNLSPEGAQLTFKLMILHNAFAVTIWPISFTLPNSFRAANDVNYPMVISVISMWTFRVALAYIFARVFGMGLESVWLAMMCDWMFRGILFAIRLHSNKWLTKYKPAG